MGGDRAIVENVVNAGVKRALAEVGYRTGFVRAATRLGDRWKVSEHAFGLARNTEERFLVLMYHRVNDAATPLSIETVPTALFDLQMGYLARHFTVRSLEDIVACLRSGTPLPRRCVAITFDDGYEDNYLQAFPILTRHKLPATVFLTAGCVEEGQPLWFDRILYGFERTSRFELVLADAGLSCSWRNMRECRRAALTALYHLMAVPHDTRLRRIETILEYLGVCEPAEPPHRLLRWGQIEAMAAGGISFGSHTLTHPILSAMASPGDVRREVVESKRLIERRLGRQVLTFAYPSGKPGDYSPAVVDEIRRAGYAMALTTTAGANYRSDDAFRLKRIRPWKQDVASFAATLTYHHVMHGEAA